MKSTLLDRGTFVVEQKRKLFELRNRYRIFVESDTEIGEVRAR
ncbi:MAG TPA: hypothetical protein VK969_10520 [Acidimicrobiia bacterium]|nr:hypothetical protein [Acidimicrobiia bacterium]